MESNKKITALILPGIGSSGSDHWQTLWEKENPSFLRLEQRDWNYPVCEEWITLLEKGVAGVGPQVVLVAHSLGSLLVAHWAARTEFKVKGALLVAPPDPNGPCFPKEAKGFSPLPTHPLRFPSIVVSSIDDPFGNAEFGESVALAWGSRFVNAGAVGHINSKSGLGAWREGFALFRQLLSSQVF